MAGVCQGLGSVHILESVFELKSSDLTRSFVFNLSVGYDLEGIKTEKMQQYIHRMIDSSDEPLFRRWIDEARKRLPGLLESAGLSSRTTAVSPHWTGFPARSAVQ
jgi:putative selenate reductase